jgi:hypothetical protein
MSFHDEDEIANDSLNPALGEIIEATLSHRRLLLAGLGTAGVAFRRRPELADLTLVPEGDVFANDLDLERHLDLDADLAV